MRPCASTFSSDRSSPSCPLSRKTPMSACRSSAVDHFVIRISTMPFAPVAVLLMLMAHAVILSGSGRSPPAAAWACMRDTADAMTATQIATPARRIRVFVFMDAPRIVVRRLLRSQSLLLKFLRDERARFLDQLIDICGVGRFGLPAPHQLVLLERVHQRLERDDRVRADLAAGDRPVPPRRSP